MVSKNGYTLTQLQNRNRVTHLENTFMAAKGERWGGVMNKPGG